MSRVPHAPWHGLHVHPGPAHAQLLGCSVQALPCRLWPWQFVQDFNPNASLLASQKHLSGDTRWPGAQDVAPSAPSRGGAVRTTPSDSLHRAEAASTLRQGRRQAAGLPAGHTQPHATSLLTGRKPHTKPHRRARARVAALGFHWEMGSGVRKGSGSGAHVHRGFPDSTSRC